MKDTTRLTDAKVHCDVGERYGCVLITGLSITILLQIGEDKGDGKKPSVRVIKTGSRAECLVALDTLCVDR